MSCKSVQKIKSVLSFYIAFLKTKSLQKPSAMPFREQENILWCFCWNYFMLCVISYSLSCV